MQGALWLEARSGPNPQWGGTKVHFNRGHGATFPVERQELWSRSAVLAPTSVA